MIHPCANRANLKTYIAVSKIAAPYIEPCRTIRRVRRARAAGLTPISYNARIPSAFSVFSAPSAILTEKKSELPN